MVVGQFGGASGERSGVQTRMLGPKDGDLLGATTAVRDRFMLSGQDSGGRFSLIEHLMPPRALGTL